LIKKILRTRLTSGFLFRRRGGAVIRKQTGNYVAGFKGFKIDKRETDGWIEIRDAQTWDLWALFRRFEALGHGALYLGFGLDKRPFAYFRPYRKIRDLETIGRAIREINRAFPFVRLSWTLRGGSLLGSRFHFRVEIIDLFGFVRFLSPLPSDLNQIVAKVDLPHFTVRRLLDDVFFLPFSLPLSVLLSGRLIYRVVLSWVDGDVLRVRRIAVRQFERGKYEVLGGYISPSAVLSVAGGIIEVEGLGNVRSGQTFMALVDGWKFGEVLQYSSQEEVRSDDRQGEFIS
jgi:hypothetical protein